ncbi:MAG: hypothetical protein ACT6S0_25895 [Roseateles sp.]|uniref:hypothetical protein n=1 Tax=Roseateles sp. TaxID=1971397 RepID=UPI004035E05B
MRLPSSTRAFFATFCLLLACPAGAQPADNGKLDRVEVAGRQVALSAWLRAESPHFVVYSDAREEDVAALLDNLEKLDHLLRLYTQPVRRAERPAAKLTLYHHARLSGLEAVDASGPADAVGLYGSCPAGVQGFSVQMERIASLADAQLDKAALNDTLSHVFEAYARHFLRRHTDIRAPAWFVEGFAQYFSSVRFSAQQMVVGRAPRALAGYLRFLGEGRQYSLEYEDVLLNDVANARSPGGAAGVGLEFTAKSWLLTHYALSSDDRRKRLSRYLSLVEQGEAPTAAFERAFDMKTADLSRVMWRYALRGTESLRVEPQDLPAPHVGLRTLPLSSGSFVLAQAALKSCPGRQAGEALLKKVTELAARFPRDQQARLTLARAQIDWGDPQHALAPLEAVLQADDAHLEAGYLMGMARLKLAGRSEGEARRAHLQAALRRLQQASASNPGSAMLAFARVQAQLATGDLPDDAALQGLLSTWQEAREVNAFAGAAALAHAYAGQADAAYRTLASLAQDPQDPATARWARQWQARLEAGVTRGDILAELRRDFSAEAPLKEWTLDKASVLRKVELGHGLEAAADFIKQQQQQQQQDRAAAPSAAPGGTGPRP